MARFVFGFFAFLGATGFAICGWLALVIEPQLQWTMVVMMGVCVYLFINATKAMRHAVD